MTTNDITDARTVAEIINANAFRKMQSFVPTNQRLTHCGGNVWCGYRYIALKCMRKIQPTIDRNDTFAHDHARALGAGYTHMSCALGYRQHIQYYREGYESAAYPGSLGLFILPFDVVPLFIADHMLYDNGLRTSLYLGCAYEVWHVETVPAPDYEREQNLTWPYMLASKPEHVRHDLRNVYLDRDPKMHRHEDEYEYRGMTRPYNIGVAAHYQYQCARMFRDRGHMGTPSYTCLTFTPYVDVTDIYTDVFPSNSVTWSYALQYNMIGRMLDRFHDRSEYAGDFSNVLMRDIANIIRRA